MPNITHTNLTIGIILIHYAIYFITYFRTAGHNTLFLTLLYILKILPFIYCFRKSIVSTLQTMKLSHNIMEIIVQIF